MPLAFGENPRDESLKDSPAAEQVDLSLQVNSSESMGTNVSTFVVSIRPRRTWRIGCAMMA